MRMYSVRKAVLFLFASFLLGGPGNGLARDGQVPPLYQVGIVLFSQAFAPMVDGFREGMAQLGYREGGDLHIDVRNIDRDLSRVPGLLRAFQKKGYALVITTTTPVARVALAQTTDRKIPILFTLVASPLRSKLVESLRVPGGNASGISHIAFDTLPRRLILFKTAFPEIRRIAVFHSNRLPFLKGHVKEYLYPVAEELGIELVEFQVNDGYEFKAATAAITPGEIDGIFMLPDPLSVAMFDQLVRFSRNRRLPLMVADNALLARGGVMGYSPGFRDIGAQVAEMAGRVLQGADAGKLPVQNPQRISLLVSAREAQRLGLKPSDAILSQADQILR